MCSLYHSMHMHAHPGISRDSFIALAKTFCPTTLIQRLILQYSLYCRSYLRELLLYDIKVQLWNERRLFSLRSIVALGDLPLVRHSRTHAHMHRQLYKITMIICSSIVSWVIDFISRRMLSMSEMCVLSCMRDIPLCMTNTRWYTCF